MRIGELSRVAGVPASTIRYYERIGLLPVPLRTSSGYRDYTEGAAQRLRFIRDGQATGLRLDEIAHLIQLRERGISTCEHSLSLLRSRISDIESQIASLERLRLQLVAITDRAADFDPEECTDLAGCQVISTKTSMALA